MTWREFITRRSRVASYGAALVVALAGVARAQTLRWEQLPELPMGVVAPAASVSGDMLVVTGGLTLTGGATDLVQVMDLPTRAWVRAFHLKQARYNHAQVTLDDGRILVVGGRKHEAAGGMPPLASCELIDPVRGVTAAADLPRRNWSPTLTKLDDGRVVAAGGDSACVYDPATGTWSEAMLLHQRRVAHAAVLVRPDKVLLAGGTGMRSFERIDVSRMRIEYDMAVALPFNVDDLKAHLLPDGRVWVIGGQMIGGDTIDHTWLVTLDAAGDPSAVEAGPPLGIAEGMADHVLVATRWGLVAAGGESEHEHQDIELRDAVLLDERTLAVTRLPDLSVAHDDAAAVAWNGTVIVLGGHTRGSVLGVSVPTPVRAVEMLVEDREPGNGEQGPVFSP